LRTLIAIRKRARTDSSTAEDEAAPQLLCLLLEVREQMRVMNARLERIGAHVERIDARVCRMERGRPSHAQPAGDAAGPLPVAVRARAMQLLDLPADLLVAIASQLAEDDDLAFVLACRRLRQAVAGTERRAAGAQPSTRIGSAFFSVGKLEWAVVSCRLPLSGSLLLHAARDGQLKQLSWLRVAAVQGRWEGLLLERGRGRASARAAVGARAWMPVGCADVRVCSCEGPSARAPVAACQWLPVECDHVRICSWGWAPGFAAVAACQWLPLG
jgi:hypothetical protein